MLFSRTKVLDPNTQRWLSRLTCRTYNGRWARRTGHPISSFRSKRVSSRKTFKYRLYPSKQQEQTLLFFLRRCRDLYNSALEERRAAYQMRRISLGCFDQINELPDLKQAL